ncbi:hypothetical protein EKD16_03815 [Streptomonospora litoralis]|uniref:Uncharacterized protein n=1 Tax=Streptomonospora litoralis TaxID=2498135 RepID=A0A4P6PWW3_9ACTN|nr:hypothetical protein EKD16_03815 [Streptomonospora litoralis]
MAGPVPNAPGARRWRRPTEAATAATGPGPRTSVPVLVGGAPDGGDDDAGGASGAGPAVVGGGHAAGSGGTSRTYVRRYPPPRHREAPAWQRHSAIRNNMGCFVRQCPSSRRARARAAAAGAHEARRMARKRPWRRLFVRLVAAASAEAARKTGIGPQKPTPSGGGAPVGRARAPRATCRRPRAPDPAHPGGVRAPATRHTPRLRGPGRNTATPSRPTAAGVSPMPVHPAMIVNLWPRNALSCGHKFTIDGPSRATTHRHRRAPDPTTAGATPRPLAALRRPPSPAGTRQDGRRPTDRKAVRRS